MRTKELVACTCEVCGKVSYQRTVSTLCRKHAYEKTHVERFGSLEEYHRQRELKKRVTNLERYGVEIVFQDTARVHAGMVRKYGVEHSMQVPEVVAKSVAVKIERYGSASPNNEKAKKTNIERYGDPGFTNPEKRRETFLERYGVENASQVPEIKRRAADTFNEKYGPDGELHDEYVSKIKATNLERYGVEVPIQNEAIREKIDATLVERYGTKYVMQNKRVLERARAKYYFEGLEFDSSWELYYFLWLRDSGVEFEYKPRGIRYAKDGTPHFYYPDFLVESRYVDVKGDHLYRDGWLTSPSGKHVFREKTMCYREHGVEVVTSSGMKPAFEYVDAKYGASYVRSFRMGRAPDA